MCKAISVCGLNRAEKNNLWYNAINSTNLSLTEDGKNADRVGIRIW